MEQDFAILYHDVLSRVYSPSDDSSVLRCFDYLDELPESSLTKLSHRDVGIYQLKYYSNFVFESTCCCDWLTFLYAAPPSTSGAKSPPLGLSPKRLAIS
ncbi:MAG: hypothetical protein M1368_04425 [Thaumarchaeota archaeon]|nr:hypothetical protein [Nitrososphaerota archaeon]